MKNKILFDFSDQRSRNALFNSISSLAIKGASLVTGFFLVPISLNLIGKEYYGIWVVILSTMNWIFYLDIGLGNGLRNEYAIAISQNDLIKRKKLVSTSYIFGSFLILILMIFFILFYSSINWNFLLNTDLLVNEDFQFLAIFIVFTFLLRFLLQLVNYILLAEQKSAVTSLFPFISNFLILMSLIAFDYLNIDFISSFDFLVLVSCIVPFLVVLIYNFYFFIKSHRLIVPDFSFFDFSLLSNLYSVGLKFFFLQVSSIVVFSFSNILIIQLLNEKAVSDYNIVFQLFSYVTTFFMILISPYWSAYTEAFFKGDFSWMRKTFKFMNMLWVGVIVMVLVLLVFSRIILKVWIGDQVDPSNFFLVLNAVYVILYSHMAIHNQIVNGLGKIFLQLRIAFFTTLIFVPLSFFLISYFALGLNGVLLAMICCMLPYNILISWQVKKIIHLNAYGIWNK